MTIPIIHPHQQLEAQLQQTTDARLYRRTLAVLQYSRGESISGIARMLGVSRQSVHNWIGRYLQSPNPADLGDQPRSGRPAVLDSKARSTLRILMGTSPQQWGYYAANWTVPLIQDQLREQLGTDCSDRTLRRTLRQLGYVWKRYRYVLDPDPQKEKKKTVASSDSQTASP